MKKTEIDIDLFLAKAEWKLSFALLPKRCRISNKLIWLKHGYIGTLDTMTGLNDPVKVKLTKWHSTVEHLAWLMTTDPSYHLSKYMRKQVARVSELIASIQPMNSSNGQILKISKPDN